MEAAADGAEVVCAKIAAGLVAAACEVGLRHTVA